MPDSETLLCRGSATVSAEICSRPAYCRNQVTSAQALGLSVVFMGRLYYRGDWLPRLVDRLPASLIDQCQTNDAAPALAAYGLLGLEGIARLEGDFALAIWDSSAGCLIEARDPMGGYPLFFHDTCSRNGPPASPVGRSSSPGNQVGAQRAGTAFFGSLPSPGALASIRFSRA